MFDWLGADGVRAGLRSSKRLTLSQLQKVAQELDIPYKNKVTRNNLIELIILQFDRRIEKTFNEMSNMHAPELAEYLDKTGCSKEELMNLLSDNEIPFKKSDTRAALIRHAADQISGLGIFRRIAGNSTEEK